jgi:hypothetical protein
LSVLSLCRTATVLVAALVVGIAWPSAAGARNTSGALVSSSDCSQHEIPRNDDSYSPAVSLPFTPNFYGKRYDQLWVNNNGNVTFDGPLGEYTPFGLQSTGHAIIAPFFGDVDTRSGGSETVKYGWGETTFQGRRAFCGEWVDVGYYSYGTDKLNSFQVLLVDRGDVAAGDFDIVFNYGSIQWEAGSASGGVNGLGGTSARIGFANGDGSRENSYELPGSGINGLFLDSNAKGLIHREIDSGQAGRLIYKIRNGTPADEVEQYIAMGDSFQSGEGAGDYDADTDIGGVNQCHQSKHAYPRVLQQRGVVTDVLNFVACSGATIRDLFTNELSTEGPPWNMGAQFGWLDHLGPKTSLVTLGIAGNDVEFADVLRDCLTRDLAKFSGSCENASGDRVDDNIADLTRRNRTGGLNRLENLYDAVRARVPRGRVLINGYPRFFPYEGGKDLTTGLDLLDIFGGDGGVDGRCKGIRVTDQLWINDKIFELDNEIRDAALSMGAEYVDQYDTPDGQELCSPGDAPDFLNGLHATNIVESFHPNKEGHSRMADVFADHLQSLPEGEDYIVDPGERIQTPREVHTNKPYVTFSTTWPGSDVEMTLTSPSGRVIGRDTVADDVFHRNGPTDEVYRIADPEPGEWKVELYGRDVDPEGERTTLRQYESPAPNADPVPAIGVSKRSKSSIAVSAAGSSDPDGSIKHYVWDFGDGTYGTGREATHTYREAGNYRVTLVVQDDRNALAFATAQVDFEFAPYPFGGFKAPINAAPVVNTATAGRALPVKFSLGGDQGMDIFDTGYPKVRLIDCASGAPLDEVEETTTAGASSLKYDAGSDTYHYVWKTDRAWAGTCRRLVLGLNDGTRHTADFRLR